MNFDACVRTKVSNMKIRRITLWLNPLHEQMILIPVFNVFNLENVADILEFSGKSSTKEASRKRFCKALLMAHVQGCFEVTFNVSISQKTFRFLDCAAKFVGCVGFPQIYSKPTSEHPCCILGSPPKVTFLIPKTTATKV